MNGLLRQYFDAAISQHPASSTSPTTTRNTSPAGRTCQPGDLPRPDINLDHVEALSGTQ